MKNKILAALVAGGLLVGAGFVTSFVSSPGTASAQEDAGPEESHEAGARLFGFLEEVLNDLVNDGTIDQGQADAIVSAAQTKADEIREEREALRELFKSLVEDGVLTEDEATQLPDDHFVFNDVFDEAWEDGELTVEEMRQNSPRRHRFRRAAHLGALLDDGGIDQSEYDSLGEDHPLKQVDVSEYLDDGLITPAELREIHQTLKDDNANA